MINKTLNANFTSDQRNYFTVIVFFLAVFGFLKGVRTPSLWGYTHYLFNYDFGFVKRGLIGELAALTSSDYIRSYEFFVISSYLILILNILLLLRFSMNILRNCNLNTALPVFIYFSSVSVLYLAHCVGHFDNLVLLCVLITLSLKSFYLRYIIALMTTIFCLLTHEMFLVTFFPVVTLSLITIASNNLDLKKTILIILYILIAMVAASIAIKAVLPKEIVHESYIYTQLNQPNSMIKLRKDTFDVQFRNIADNVEFMEQYYSTMEMYFRFVIGVFATLPSSIFILFFTIRIIKSLDFQPLLWFVFAISASFSPLLLHSVATDMERFNSLSILASFLVFIIFSLDFKGGKQLAENVLPNKVSWRVVTTSTILICLNLGTKIALFDLYQVDFYPFYDKIIHVLNTVFLCEDFFVMPNY